MNRDQYYHGLDPNALAHNRWLIVAIEAASYCEECSEKDIRFSRLRERCDNALNEITGTSINFGNFDSNINICCRKGFLSRKKVDKKDTRIRPNIPAVQKKINAMRIENLDGNKKLRIVGKYFTGHVSLPPLVESVSISDSLARQTSKARALSESVSISDSLVMTVTKAKDVSK